MSKISIENLEDPEGGITLEDLINKYDEEMKESAPLKKMKQKPLPKIPIEEYKGDVTGKNALVSAINIIDKITTSQLKIDEGLNRVKSVIKNLDFNSLKQVKTFIISGGITTFGITLFVILMTLVTNELVEKDREN